MKTKLYIQLDISDETTIATVWTTQKRWKTQLDEIAGLMNMLEQFKSKYTIRIRANEPLDRELMIETTMRARELGHSVAF